MNRIQRGFTLIELVMVIVIIGVLAAIAVPRFVDLSAEANQAATNGVAGSLSSGAAINYAARKANSAKGSAVDNCNDGASLLQGGALPTGYSITAAAVAADASATCALAGPGSTTANFTIIGIN